MSARIQIGRIKGATLFWHISCFLVFVLVIWSLDVVVLPRAAPGLSLLEYWEIAIGTGIVFLLSVLLHEAAHVTMARRHGVAVQFTTLYGFIGAAHTEGRPSSPVAALRIALAGPVMSLALAGLFALLWLLLREIAWLRPALAWLAWLNLGVGLFNLLPVSPLAGWRVLQAAVWRWKGQPLAVAPHTIVFSTEITGAVLLGAGFIFLVLGSYVVAAWLALLGWALQQVVSVSALAESRPSPPQQTQQSPVAPPVSVAAVSAVAGQSAAAGDEEPGIRPNVPLSSSLWHVLEVLESEQVEEVVITDDGRPVARVSRV